MANFVRPFEKLGCRRCRFRGQWLYYAYLLKSLRCLLLFKLLAASANRVWCCWGWITWLLLIIEGLEAAWTMWLVAAEFECREWFWFKLFPKLFFWFWFLISVFCSVKQLKLPAEDSLLGPVALPSLLFWLLLGWTGSMIAMVLDFWEEALILSIISRGRASLILWLGTENNYIFLLDS